MSAPLQQRLSRLASVARADLAAEIVPRAGVDSRRVRHEVRDGAAVMAFSALASTVLALALLLLVTWAGRA